MRRTIRMYTLSIDGSEYECGSSIEREILDRGLNPDSFIFLIDGDPVPMDSVPVDRKVRAIRVTSGG